MPVIVKPNYEGSSKGIGDEAVARDARQLAEMLPRALRSYPDGRAGGGVRGGQRLTVPFLEGYGDEGVLLPVDYEVDPAARSRFNLYDYRLKSADSAAGLGALSGRPAARHRGPGARHHQGRRCGPWASATWGASTSAWPRTVASTCWRSTPCPRWRGAPAASRPPRARVSTTPTRCRRSCRAPPAARA